MLIASISFFGDRCVHVCDGRCDKAWGINGRPSRKLSDEPDDYVFLGDGELGTAPYPHSWEGGDGRPSDEPLTDATKINKWCVRECERGHLLDINGRWEFSDASLAEEMANPRPNIPKEEASNGE